MLRSKITQFLSYKHQNAREIIHIYNSLTLNYALFRFFGVMGTGTEVNPQSWTQPLQFICEEEH